MRRPGGEQGVLTREYTLPSPVCPAAAKALLGQQVFGQAPRNLS